jgi:hypothetical protein
VHGGVGKAHVFSGTTAGRAVTTAPVIVRETALYEILQCCNVCRGRNLFLIALCPHSIGWFDGHVCPIVFGGDGDIRSFITGCQGSIR